MLGFTNTLVDIIEKEKPTHIVVVFDSSCKTFRNEIFEDYKANRQKQPEDITNSLPYIRKIISAFNIRSISLDGYEADDIIGTIAKKADDFETYIMSQDKDLAQLVNERVFLYRGTRSGSADIMGKEEVNAKWQIQEPIQIIDLLALQGDTSDNVPGIPSIGPKTASKLIAKFHTIEELFQSLNKIPEKQRNHIQSYKDQAILAKNLITIKTDTPIDVDFNSMKYIEYDTKSLQELLHELELNRIYKKLFPTIRVQKKEQSNLFQRDKEEESIDKDDIREEKNIDNTLHDYHIIDTPSLRRSLVGFLKIQKQFSFNITTVPATNSSETIILGISFSYYPKESSYVVLPTNMQSARIIVKEFDEIFSSDSIQKIGNNIKQSIIVLNKYDVTLKGPFFDTMIASYLIEPEKRNDIDSVSKGFLNYTMLDEYQVKNKNMETIEPTEIDSLIEYSCECSDLIFRVKEILSKKISEMKFDDLYYTVEIPLIEVLSDMEIFGVTINKKAVEDFGIVLDDRIDAIKNRIHEIAGESFNVASGKQLGNVLFEKLKIIDNPKKTRTGRYATHEEVLVDLEDKHEIISYLLDYKKYEKLKNTYVNSLLGIKGNKVHTSYNQAITVTGRLSSTNPNLQNIPIRSDDGKHIRSFFIPSLKEHCILSADYSQIELRFMAHFSKDMSMIKAFREDADIHVITASRIYKISPNEVNDDMRRNAKAANFGIIYGISAFGLSKRLRIPKKEAKEIIDVYFEEFPEIKNFTQKIVEEAREKRFLESILFRKRYFPNINSRNYTMRSMEERNAINFPIQSSAADLMKLAMIKIHKHLISYYSDVKMIMQVHDEIVFDAPKRLISDLIPCIKTIMEEAMNISVPIKTNIKVGDNWLNLQDVTLQ